MRGTGYARVASPARIGRRCTGELVLMNWLVSILAFDMVQWFGTLKSLQFADEPLSSSRQCVGIKFQKIKLTRALVRGILFGVLYLRSSRGRWQEV